MTEWQGYYSTSQVSRLAAVPKSTLYDWKARGIVVPSVKVVDKNNNIVDEGYSYADLAIVKLLRALRVKQLNLRTVANSLRHLYERFGALTSSGWEDAHVYVIGKEVFAHRPEDWDTTVASREGQKGEMRVLGELCEEEAGIIIPKDFADYVEIDLDVMEGQPVVRDTRVPTFMLAMMFDQGVSLDQLTGLYRTIPRVSIEKAIQFERSLDGALTKADSS